MNFAHPIFVGVASGVLGLAIGAAGQTEPETTTKESVVTVTVPGPEKTVEVEVTPRSCLDAIKYAREGFDTAASFAGVVSDFIGAASEFDVDEMERQSGRMPAVNARLESIAPKFRLNAAECEAK